MTNTRIKRDVEDRLADRVQAVHERQTLSGDAKAQRERLEAFRDKWQNSALPDIPRDAIPGMHLC